MTALALAAEANLVTHMGWVQARVPGMRVLADDALTIVDSGLPCDTFNFVCRARLDGDVAASRILAATAHFTRAARPFSWWVGPADRPADLGRLLQDAGYTAAESELAMAADLDRLATFDLAPHGLRIERVRNAAGLREFATINAANWSPPDPDVLTFYERAAYVLLRPDCPLRFYLGYLDGLAVATAELAVSDAGVGLYNISTLADFRRRGFGTALTLRPLLDARDEGFGIAVLQAAADGVGVYSRIGFRETGRYTEYKIGFE